MRDVSKKIKTHREAIAKATIKVSPSTISRVKENKIPKGNPLEVAKVAAIQAAKNTSEIIPYCHPLPVDYVGVDFELREGSIEVTTTVKAIYKTGVEMEALTSASVAVLTLYDMLKMLDDKMEIQEVKLIRKKGGKSDFREKYDTILKAAVLVASDSISQGKKDDLSGKLIVDRLKEEGIDVIDYKIVSDEISEIEKALVNYTDNMKLDMVLTTGGTGFSPRDNMPEVMLSVMKREIPGIPEASRSFGQERTPYAMLSRGKAGLRGKTLIVNLPGSKNGVRESLDALFPGILHSFTMIWGGGHPSKQKEFVKARV